MTLEEAYKIFSEGARVTLARLEEEVATLRSGRVTTNLIESISVEHYGARLPLNGVASIGVSDARTLVISPWDPGALDAIRKALTAAELGAQPMDDGNVVRLVFPSLTEENREKSLKILRGYAESARVRLRQARDEALSIIRTGKQKGGLTEDDFYEGREKLDELIDKANEAIAVIIEKKEAEVRTV